MTNDSLNGWPDELSQLLRTLTDRDPSDLIKDLRKLAESIGHDAADALLDANPDLFEYSPALTEGYYRHILDQEDPQVERLLRQQFDREATFSDILDDHTLTLYNRSRETFERLELDHCARLTMVGCGKLPFTMFRVHDSTTIPEIVGLDVRTDAVGIANQIASRLNCRRIQAQVSDGRSYDYCSTQCAYIAGMVLGKAAVISRIADTGPDGIQVIVREPFSLGRLWMESGISNLDPRLEVIGQGNDTTSLSRDVYLRRCSRK